MSCVHRRRTTLVPLCLTVVVVLIWAASAAAQEPVRSFDQLDTRLKVGDTVWVTTAQGREVKGKIDAFAGGSLKLRNQSAALMESDVVSIAERPHDSLKWGALIGLGVGVGLAAISVAAYEDDAASAAAAVGMWGGIGAAVGAGIDAMIPMPKRIVYRAHGREKGSFLSIAPFLGPRAKGLRVSFAF